MLTILHSPCAWISFCFPTGTAVLILHRARAGAGGCGGPRHQTSPREFSLSLFEDRFLLVLCCGGSGGFPRAVAFLQEY